MLSFACSLTKTPPRLYSPISPVQRVQLGRGSNSKTATNQALLKTLLSSSKRLAPLEHLPPVFFEGSWSRNKQTSFLAPILYLNSLACLSHHYIATRMFLRKYKAKKTPFLIFPVLCKGFGESR